MTKEAQLARNARMRRALDVAAKQQAALQAEHEATFLAFHDNSTWAKAKVKAGTVRYTAEGFAFLSRGVAERAEDAKHQAELDATLAKEKADAKL